MADAVLVAVGVATVVVAATVMALVMAAAVSRLNDATPIDRRLFGIILGSSNVFHNLVSHWILFCTTIWDFIFILV